MKIQSTRDNHRRKFKIGILGLGHVGLPTALGLAELGWEVIGADDDATKVALIQAGRTPFYEPGLDELLARHICSDRFQVTADVGSAIRSTGVLFLCVGTPQRESGEADMTQMEAVSREIAHNLNGYKLIVEKSTAPAITGQWIRKTIRRYAGDNGNRSGNGRDYQCPQEQASDSDSDGGFDVVSNPEFLQEGKAVQDFFHPDRVVCGVQTDRAREIMEELYRPLGCPVVFTDLTTAELIKHAANAFLATKISFINMVADMCEAVGADVTQVAHGLGLDSRIGHQFLRAGLGFGGYCLPKDLRAFIYLGEEHRVDCGLLREVERVNQHRVTLFLKKVRQALWVVRGKTLGVFGLAFKPATDDIREAPSLRVIAGLLEEGASLRLYDPQAMPSTQQIFPEQSGRVAYCSSPYEAAQETDALLLLTEWDEFQRLDLPRLRDLMQVPVLIDGRNLVDPARARAAGFEYICFGRQAQAASLFGQPEMLPTADASLR